MIFIDFGGCSCGKNGENNENVSIKINYVMSKSLNLTDLLSLIIGNSR